MKLMNSVKSLILALYYSIKRFPITIGLTTSISIILIIIRQIESDLSRGTLDNLSRLVMVLALGVPLSLCIRLSFERNKSAQEDSVSSASTKKHISPYSIYELVSYILGAIFLVLYYLYLIPDFDMVNISRYVAINITLYLGFFFIPYLPQKQNFEHYVIKVLSGFFLTIIYSIVLFGGLSAIMFTLDKLLSVPIKSNYYFYVWLITAGVFAPSHFLGGLPTSKHTFSDENYSKPLKVLLLYIVMPIITAYTAILYIYFAKIIITLQWPVGLVSHLVLWFSVVSTGVIFFISPLFEVNNWVKTFVFWFTKLIIPLIIMMFISIFIRINAYGITENRYYVIVLGLWVLGMMIYLTFTKTKKNIILPISLALIATLSVIGPWSSFSLAKLSQNNRFEKILLENNMLSDNKIVKKDTGISDKDKTELSQILTYFEGNHELSDMRYLPENFAIKDMDKTFGFSYYFNDYYNDQTRKYFTYSAYELSNPIDISGYDYFIDSRRFYSDNQLVLDGNVTLKYSVSDGKLEILQEDKTIYHKSISDFGQHLFEKYGMMERFELDPEDMEFIEETDKFKFKFAILHVYGEKDPSSEKVTVKATDFYIMVKIK